MRIFDPDRKKYPIWTLFFGVIFLAVWSLGILPAFLDKFGFFEVSSKIRIFYKALCHGIPERCPYFLDYPAAVCFRCTGIDLGFFLAGALLYPVLRRYLNPEAWPIHLAFITVFAFFIFAEWLSEFLGIINSRWFFQFFTGMLFSGGISFFLFSVAENIISSYGEN